MITGDHKLTAQAIAKDQEMKRYIGDNLVNELLTKENFNKAILLTKKNNLSFQK